MAAIDGEHAAGHMRARAGGQQQHPERPHGPAPCTTTPTPKDAPMPIARDLSRSFGPIRAGEELSYDYGLIIDERYTPKLKAEYPCWCGSKNCRGTLLAPKRNRK